MTKEEVNMSDDIRVKVEINGHVFYDFTTLCNTQTELTIALARIQNFNLEEMSRFSGAIRLNKSK